VGDDDWVPERDEGRVMGSLYRSGCARRSKDVSRLVEPRSTMLSPRELSEVSVQMAGSREELVLGAEVVTANEVSTNSAVALSFPFTTFSSDSPSSSLSTVLS
jgi:hypothetical protein